MMLARVCRAGTSPVLASFLKKPVLQNSLLSKGQTFRLFGNEGRSGFTRSARNRVSDASDVLQTGRLAILGGCAVGLTALCYYGANLTSQTSVVNYAMYWPQYVKERIRTTYAYLGASALVTTVSAVMCARSPLMARYVMAEPLTRTLALFALVIGSQILVRSIPYKEGVGAKQLAFLLHTGIIGMMLAPVCLLHPAIVQRALFSTAGVVGGLSLTAMCAPNDKFLGMAGPLAIGLGVVIASSLGTMFLGPAAPLAAGLHRISVYGGLVVFSGFLLYDTQRIIRQAEVYPVYARSEAQAYDPINNALSIYVSIVNIFMSLLSMQGQKKR